MSGASRRQQYEQTLAFYEDKVKHAPNNARYNNFLAALYAAQGTIRGNKAADAAYLRTLATQPQNMMARSDYALHLSRQGRYEDSIDEFHKAMITVEDQPTLRKNLAAVLASRGEYSQAMQHATRALQLNSGDSMSHRNVAKIYSIMGDTRASLEHNLRSIDIEDPSRKKPHTSAYRAAAVQIISRGGDRQQAHDLMDAARRIEGKKNVLETSNRTYEIISSIMKRQGDKLKEIEKEDAEKLKKEQEAAIRRGDIVAPVAAGGANKDAKDSHRKKSLK
jgi:tetratricopeptide (TPR) repeat protein